MINESIKNISTSAFFKGENVGCRFESDNLTSIYKGFYTQTHILPKISLPSSTVASIMIVSVFFDTGGC